MRRTALGAATILVLAGCYEQILVPGDEANDRIEITNDEFVLDQRVSYPDEDVPIDSAAASPAFGFGAVSSRAPARVPSSVTLTLITEVTPPTVSGEVVQATAVWVTGDDKSVVSYNFRGTPALGALDYFEKLDREVPKLKSSATFSDADVNAVTIDGKAAYIAELSSNTALPSSAVVERLSFKGGKFTLEAGGQLPIASFAATSTLIEGNTLYATSGDDGAVYALDENDLSILGEYALDDARWVAFDKDGGRILVVQGTPGRLSVFEEGAFPGGSMNLLGTYSFPGADVPESKSTVEAAGELAFIAAGPEGVQVMCIDDGVIEASVPRPDPASLGLDPSVVVTNSVTVDDDLMFISNGEAGVYVAAADDDFKDIPCGSSPTITMLGKLRFGDLESVNHVMYRNKVLYIAAGLGGIKVVEVDVVN